MAKSPKKDPQLEDLDRLERFAKLQNDERVRKLVELERKLTLAESGKKEVADKLKVTLSDLDVAEKTLQRFSDTQGQVSVKKLRRLKRRAGGQATAIICLNDWHLEERVDPESIEGLNEFNLDIAEKRIHRVCERAMHLLEFARGVSNIKELVVWLGGDLINGYIHEELMDGNFLGPTDAIRFAQDKVATGLQHFLKQSKVNKITVVTSQGNHGRSTKAKFISTGYKTSWEYGAYLNLADKFASDPKIVFKVSQGYHNNLDIQGHLIRFHHGDAIRYMGGVGGVHVPVRKKIAQWNKAGRSARLDILGHFHQYCEDWYYIVCGCLVGYTAYALHIGAEFQRPTQTFIVIDKNEGKVMCLPIFCAEIPQEEQLFKPETANVQV